VDLANFDSIRSYAEKFKAEVSRLDIFVANAGVGAMDYKTSIHGFEQMYAPLPSIHAMRTLTNMYDDRVQVNGLGTDLLSILLLPKMIDTAKEFNVAPRLVIVSSDGHHSARPLDDAMLQSSSIHSALSHKDYWLSVPLHSFFHHRRLTALIAMAWLGTSPPSVS
jgi:NAD(P)-dependent dehydrogenase (short-subunit alcohol dehydrogenase family)